MNAANNKDPLNLEEMAKYVDNYAKEHPAEFEKFTQEMNENVNNCKDREDDICKLPKEDTAWLIVGQKPEVFRVEKRTLILVDKEGVYLGYNTEDVSVKSLSEQAYTLICLSCLFPLTGTARRPRFVTYKDSELARNNKLNLNSLKIKFIDPETVETLELDPELMFVRECCSCRKRGQPDLFKECASCEGLIYCSKKCQKQDWKRKDNLSAHAHRHWCPKIKIYMNKTDELALFPFTFTEETTDKQFHQYKYKDFLVKQGIYNVGLWRRECPITLQEADKGCSFGDLSSDDNPYILPVESSVLAGTPDTPPPASHQPITNWTDYYKWRGFKLDSPIAILLHFPLTLYYIITSHFAQDFSELWSDIVSNGNMKINIIGVEKEVEMLMVFQEFGNLLPAIQFDIHMFGKEILPDLNNKVEKYGNVTLTIHHQLYHHYKGDKSHLAVGFNSGIGAYISWGETIKQLKNESMPAYFTDYCQYSCECARSSMKSVSVFAGATLINPFRNPVRKICTENNMPWYSNGFFFKLNYEPQEEEGER